MTQKDDPKKSVQKPARAQETGPLLEGVDYTVDAFGRWVFTREYHLKRGYCCGSGCVHCPFEHINVKDPAKK